MTVTPLEQFVTLWVVIDPIGTIPVFIAVTARMNAKARKIIALEAALVATVILMAFLVGGQFLIDALDISLPAFQIAGGMVLFIFALTMIFGPSKPDVETSGLDSGRPASSPAVYPLAVPSLASPGAMLAIVILTDNNRFSVAEQAITAGMMLLVMLAAAAMMLLATPILRIIGNSGAAIISRVMGMILASVAVDNVIEAVIELIRTVQL
ncbi:MarC family protein [Qingshengfaniella alkalisoli]|uniref:UPF0056 membrane protein n=1 Tax=Qingshengfaniella alkalisoli TaxID=2599296 RepID=A0A5B8I9Y0_9RHOB|nr:MarC family protein [Qingshengfaniella alkalisoli]QDY69926.1 MarC family protein [Qingshengfaniella alkalisoli]